MSAETALARTKIARALACVRRLAPRHARGAAHAGEREAFVTNQLANTIGVVDLAAMKQIVAIAVTGAPAGLAMSPSGDFAYVTAPDGKELIAIDAGKRAIAWRLSVGEGPLGIAVNPQTGIVYVANWYGDEIVAVDADKRAIVSRVKVGRAPSGLAVTPDGALLLSADRESDAISLIDTKTMQRIGEVKVGTHPFGLAIEPDGKRAYVANVVSNDVSIVDLATRKVTATLPVGARPYGVAFAGGKVVRHQPRFGLRQRLRHRRSEARHHHPRRRLPGRNCGNRGRQRHLRRLLGGQHPRAHRCGDASRNWQGRGRRRPARLRQIPALIRGLRPGARPGQSQNSFAAAQFPRTLPLVRTSM